MQCLLAKENERTGKPASIGQPEQASSQNKTSRTREPVQDSQDKTVRTAKTPQNRKDKQIRLEEDNQNRRTVMDKIVKMRKS
jgi:hypothetical protein